MAENALLLAVHLLDGRYHGAGDWPPAPFRVFQALVAGALVGEPPEAVETVAPAFMWLEALDPPEITVPPTRQGARTLLWVPNNDLDKVGGDPAKVADLRTGKQVQPRVIESDPVLRYLWHFDPDRDGAADHAAALVEIADGLYQLGRGVDMAFARAEVLAGETAVSRLRESGHAIHRPMPQAQTRGTPLATPVPGSFAALRTRHAAQRGRQTRDGLKTAPPPYAVDVIYDAPPRWAIYHLYEPSGTGRFKAKPLTGSVHLVETVRDRLAAILCKHHDARRVERLVVGRDAGPVEKPQRIRILPLPSIGHDEVAPAIRRVLIEVPPDCPLPADEIFWAAGRVDLNTDSDGVVQDTTQYGAAPCLVPLGPETADTMCRHYLPKQPGARVWRTITPAALPERAARRHISPDQAHAAGAPKKGTERLNEEAQAAKGVRAALGHAGVTTPVAAITVQREPFQRRGARAEAFAPGTRFAANRLWHVAVTFAAPVAGPLVLGDGRYLGLGVMAPAPERQGVTAIFALAPDYALPIGAAADLVRAARRALMALARDPRGQVETLFSGHERDGQPAREAEGRHRHVFLAAADADGDGRLDHLIVAPPWACDKTGSKSRDQAKRFDAVVGRLRRLRAGPLGLIHMSDPLSPEEVPGLTGPADTWVSHTAYHATRHAKPREDLDRMIDRDVRAECDRRGLPRPEVCVLDAEAGPRGGQPRARLRLRFAITVAGPLLLGRDSHKGGGLFLPDSG